MNLAHREPSPPRFIYLQPSGDDAFAVAGDRIRGVADCRFPLVYDKGHAQ